MRHLPICGPVGALAALVVALAVPTDAALSSSSSAVRDYRSITSAASIRRVVRASAGTTLTVAGLTYASKGRTARLGCRYQRIAAIDPGAKRVLCADIANGTPLPDSYGFLLTQRLAATLTYGANGSVKVDTRWRLPRCACDK